MPNALDYNGWYRVLDLAPGAGLQQIDENWKLLVSAWHPDKFVGGLRDKATERLQEVNSARDELTRYWREFGRAPPTSPLHDLRIHSMVSPGWQNMAQPAAAAPPQRRSGPDLSRRMIKLTKWLLLLGVVWVTWRPIQWNKETAVIELFFWLLMLFGCAQLFEGIANAVLGALMPRRKER